MNFNDLRSYLMAKSAAVEEFPFDAVTLVIKVSGKMFALVGTNDDPLRLNLKCDPDKAEIHSMIDDSYALVVQGLPKSKRPV
ncbi:MAG: MmcQ/YjbR family DNA-binding protein [Desulfuromonas sp.]|nr:MmcQ/YjbR family DNA-binding protein [Desulfuromonas sp.]